MICGPRLVAEMGISLVIPEVLSRQRITAQKMGRA